MVTPLQVHVYLRKACICGRDAMLINKIVAQTIDVSISVSTVKNQPANVLAAVGVSVVS